MASIQRKIDSKGKKRYYIVFRDPLTGKQKWRAAGVKKEDAEPMLCDIISDIVRDKLDKSSSVRFSDFCALWLNMYAKPTYKPSTYATAIQRIRGQLIPYFGKRSLSSITPEDIQGYVNQRTHEGVSASTIIRDLATLRTVLSCACRWGCIKVNPSTGIGSPKPEKRRFTLLSPDELSRLFDAAEEPCRTIFMVAALSGMKRSELLALSWTDIDWVKDEIVITKTIYRGIITPIKTAASIRRIPLPPALKEALVAHRKRCPDSQENLVFIHPDGRRIDANNLTRRTFKRALRRAGLPNIRFCDLRHTYASLLIRQGVDVANIQRHLGHASVKTTLTTYGPLI